VVCLLLMAVVVLVLRCIHPYMAIEDDGWIDVVVVRVGLEEAVGEDEEDNTSCEGKQGKHVSVKVEGRR
jgi:hypothetical protein